MFAQRQKIRMIRLIVFSLLSIVLCPISAKQPSKPSMSVEQRQQFTYYWYAARQAITEERYADAYTYLQFCNMINPKDGQTLTFIGMMLQGIGDEERALEAYKQAFEADPHDQWFKYSSALLAQRTQGSTDEALKVLEKAYKSQESRAKSQESNVDEDLLEQLKRLYISEEMWKEALAMQNELDKIKGYDAYSALTFYRIYRIQGKKKKAIAALDKYLELDPTDVQFMLFRLDMMEETKAKPKELYAIFDRILAIAPHNLGVLNNYAWTLAINGGDLTEAERMSAITIREEPDNATFLDTYGWILHLKGQDDLALFYLNRALWHATEGNKEVIEEHIKQIKK